MARRKLIPKQIELAGQVIKTVCAENLIQKHNAHGLASVMDNTITLQKSTRSMKASCGFQEQVYFHELVHHILAKMGEDELFSNEKFVDLFGMFLHQALKSAKY